MTSRCPCDKSHPCSVSRRHLHVESVRLTWLTPQASCCILEFKEPLRLVVLGGEAEREGVGSCGFDVVAGRSVGCGG